MTESKIFSRFYQVEQYAAQLSVIELKKETLRIFKRLQKEIELIPANWIYQLNHWLPS